MYQRMLPWLLLAAPLLAAPPVRVLIVTGGHDHETSFYTLFDDARISAVVDPHPSAFTSDFRERTDVLVLYDLVQELREENRRDNLRAFVESGKGVVVLHHAVCDYPAWRWWVEDVAGVRYLPTSTYKHGEQIHVKVAKKHPVTDGLTDFDLEDETYKGLWISPKVQVLLTTDNPTSDGPVAWLGPDPKLRVVCVQLGHSRAAHQNANYRQLVRNAIFWAANREAK